MATEITVSAGYIPNFALQGYSPAAGDTVSLLWQLTEDGLDDDGVPRLRGTGPTIACTVYVWDSVDARFEDGAGAAMPSFSPALSQYDGPYALYIPSFQIDPTSDWLRPRPGRYSVKFRTPDLVERRWQDWQDIVVPIDPNPIRLIDISLYSKGGVSGWGYEEAYTKEEVDAKITAALSGAIDNPMTAVGDMIYGSTVVLGLATPTRLAATTNGFFLKLAAGLPAWAALTSGEISTALGFTPENAANKNAASGYAGLSAGSKITASQMTEVLGLPDLTDVAPGAVPTSNHFLVGNGSAWSNSALGSSHVTTALGFTPENAANKNAASGYAGLSAGSKITGSQITEVIGLADLTDVAPGAVPTSNHFLVGNGTAWSNSALGSSHVTTALGFTPENAANRNAASGYAPLDGSTKVPLANITEVLGLVNLTDVAAAPTSTSPLLHYQGGALRALGGDPDNTGTPASSTNLLMTNLVQEASPSTNLSAAGASRYFPYQVTPVRAGWISHGEYAVAHTEGGGSLGSPGNIFQLAGSVVQTGTRPAVAVFGNATAAAGDATLPVSVWGGNFVAYTDAAADDASALGIEINFGNRDAANASATAVGLVIAAVNAGPAGTIPSFIQLQDNGSANKASTGLAILAGCLRSTGVAISLPGMTAHAVIDATLGTYVYGIDFASTTFSAAAIRFPARLVAAGAGTVPGPAMQNAENTGALAVFSHNYSGTGAANDGNVLYVGDFAGPASGAGWHQMRFHVEKNAAGTSGSGTNRAVISRFGLGGIHLNGWHGSGTVPTLVTGAFTGGGTENPSITSTSIVGRDPAHVISFSTQTAPAANAKIFAITFVEAYANAPVVALTAETGGVAESELHVRNRSTTGYEVWSGATALTAATAYVVNAVVIGFE